MLLQGKQGQLGKQVGQNLTAGMGEYSELLVTELQGRYYENAYRGIKFYAVTTAAQALSVASSTFTGLVVQNPGGSGKNLAISEIIWATSLAVTGLGAVVLAYGASTTAGALIALTTGNSSGPSGVPALLGNSAKSVANVGASCTSASPAGAATTAPTI